MRNEIKTVLVHGFNINDEGKHTVQKLLPALKRRHKGVVKNWAYGWFGLFSVIFRNKSVAKGIKAYLEQSVWQTDNYAVGHSNGCAILVEAARQGCKFKRLLLINPALKVDTVFPDSIESIVIVHTEADKPTRTARFFDRVPLVQLIVPNAWGAMGALGYQGKADKRVTNKDMSFVLEGHSDIFTNKNMRKYGAELVRELYAK